MSGTEGKGRGKEVKRMGEGEGERGGKGEGRRGGKGEGRREGMRRKG